MLPGLTSVDFECRAWVAELHPIKRLQSALVKPFQPTGFASVDELSQFSNPPFIIL
ncbi:MAG: hypothetical protein WHW07_02065 [Bacteroidales bacterium]